MMMNIVIKVIHIIVINVSSKKTKKPADIRMERGDRAKTDGKSSIWKRRWRTCARNRKRHRRDGYRDCSTFEDKWMD